MESLVRILDVEIFPLSLSVEGVLFHYIFRNDLTIQAMRAKMQCYV